MTVLSGTHQADRVTSTGVVAPDCVWHPRLKGDRPRFILLQLLVEPRRVEVRAVWPGDGAEFEVSLGEEILVFQWFVHAAVLACAHCTEVYDALATVVEGNREAVRGQYG